MRGKEKEEREEQKKEKDEEGEGDRSLICPLKQIATERKAPHQVFQVIDSTSQVHRPHRR